MIIGILLVVSSGCFPVFGPGGGATVVTMEITVKVLPGTIKFYIPSLLLIRKN
jgi:hypothetical protein